MARTFAAGGVQPVMGERIVGAEAVERALSVMSTCGMYDYSGTWMYEVGVPAMAVPSTRLTNPRLLSGLTVEAVDAPW